MPKTGPTSHQVMTAFARVSRKPANKPYLYILSYYSKNVAGEPDMLGVFSSLEAAQTEAARCILSAYARRTARAAPSTC